MLCDSLLLRRRMADRGRVEGPGFTLSLHPWIRQAQATAVNLPFLVPLDLVGVPANAWTRHTADVILDGFGYVVDVAEETASRNEMSHFRVWLHTADLPRIPTRKFLFVKEPPLPSATTAATTRRAPRVSLRGRAGTLRYPIQIRHVADAPVPQRSPPPPPLDPERAHGLAVVLVAATAVPAPRRHIYELHRRPLPRLVPPVGAPQLCIARSP